LLHSKKDEIEKLAERLLENEVLNLPDIVEIMGPRPFPMKETVKEYLSELKEREQVEESLAEETFKKWMDNEKANLDKLEKDSEKHVEAMKAMEEIEKEIAESVEKGETV